MGWLRRAFAEDPSCVAGGLAHLRQSISPFSLMNLETADQNNFAAMVNTEFMIVTGGGPVPMVLEEVRLLGHRRAGATREPFALTFCAKGGEILPQATYPVTHPQLGGFDLFLVPVGRATGGGVHHEAIFT